MPHDKNGKLLQKGDAVVLRCIVTEVYETTDYCNVNVTTVEKMYPGDSPSTFSVNAKQVEKITITPEPLLPDAA